MPRASEIVKCVDCGKQYPRKLLNHKLRCADCAMRKMRDIIFQISNKSGPEYEHWKERCLAKASRYTNGIKGGVGE